VRKTEIPRQSRKQECRNKETKNRKVPICRKIEKSKKRKIFRKKCRWRSSFKNSRSGQQDKKIGNQLKS